MVDVIESGEKGKKDTILALQKLENSIKDGKEIEEELDNVFYKVEVDAFLDCPKDTSMLASTIKIVKTPIGTMDGTVSSIKSITIYDRTIVAGDLTARNPKTKGPVNYAGWVHDGYISKDGTVHSGRPFLTNALAKHDAELTSAINRALDKLGKKFSGES
jgi:hypothetical protein